MKLLLHIQILDEEIIEPGISCKLLGVKPVAHNFLVLQFWRQMANPRAHQIQDFHFRSKNLPVQIGELRDEFVVDVSYEPRVGVEFSVGGFVEFRSVLSGEDEPPDSAGGGGGVVWILSGGSSGERRFFL